jgi:uncharacterized protein YjbI with pentapeptide repeats
VLIIPIVLAIGALLFNASQKKTEFEIARERLYEEVLQSYLDKMGQLLLKEDLLATKDDPEAKVRKIAQVQTVTTLRKVGTARQSIIFQFLRDAGLVDFLLVGASMIEIDMHATSLIEVDLSGANLTLAELRLVYLKRAILSGANLSGAKLMRANLSGAYLSKGDLSKANLSKADLSKAGLSESDLTWANGTPEQLSHAKSLKGATMPDGSVHE